MEGVQGLVAPCLPHPRLRVECSLWGEFGLSVELGVTSQSPGDVTCPQLTVQVGKGVVARVGYVGEKSCQKQRRSN